MNYGKFGKPFYKFPFYGKFGKPFYGKFGKPFYGKFPYWWGI